MIVAGIDPGLRGGAAVLCDGTGFAPVSTMALPICRDKSLAWVHGKKLRDWLIGRTGGAPFTCVVERVGSMPEQGVASSFKFGVGFGAILSIVQTLSCELVLVHPVVWKRALGLLHTDKSQSLVCARQLYPHAYLPTPKHTDQAEALLIAHWYREFKLAKVV